MGLNDNIIKYRKLKLYTQDDLAEKMGVSRQSVSKWENGESMPDINKLTRIADTLEVSLDALFDRQSIVQTEQKVVATQDIKLDLKPNILRTFMLCIAALIVGMGIGVGIGLGVGRPGVEETAKKSTSKISINEIEVSGFSFSPGMGMPKSYNKGMIIEFVPSIYDEEYEFKIYANADDSYNNRVGKPSFKNGRCKCTLNTTTGARYNIVLEISHEDEVRYITLAEAVWGDGSGQNIPSEE